MKTTLIFLTYNRLGSVIRTFESLKHTLADPNINWIILDNASTDKTPSWLLQFASHYSNVDVHLYGKNLGVAGGRDYLLHHAKGDIIGILDSDIEVYRSDFLPLIHQTLQNKQIGICGKSGHAITSKWKTLPYSPEYTGRVDVLSGYCQFFRRKDYLRNHIQLDLDFNYHGVEDDDLCAQFLEKGYVNWQIGNLPIRHMFSGTWGTEGYDNNRKRFENKWKTKSYLFRML